MDNFIISFLSGCLGGVLVIWGFFKFFVDTVETESTEDEQSIPEDWVLPLKLQYTKSVWYAWDIEDNFVLQASSKSELITDILNKYEIPPKRLSIESENELNEDNKK